MNQFLSKHSQTMLEKLNHQRLNNQFCDITLLIEGEEFRAHKAVLAACSDYFHELFFEKGAASTHEAVVDLSGESSLLHIFRMLQHIVQKTGQFKNGEISKIMHLWSCYYRVR